MVIKMTVFHMLALHVLLLNCVHTNAIQCHRCAYTKGVTLRDGNTTEYETGVRGCLDPFQSSDVGLVECTGESCYANVTYFGVRGTELEYTSVYRGCSSDHGIDCGSYQGCQNDTNLATESLNCVYCCNQADHCNTQNVVETAQNVFKCQECHATLNDERTYSTDLSNQCGWLTANDIPEIPCPSQVCMTLVTPVTKDHPPTINKTCADNNDIQNYCQNETSLENVNYEVNCCNTSLCNTGREAPRVIECWTCEADLTEDGLPADDSPCSRDDFNGTGATLVACDSGRNSGYCTSIWLPSNDGITRTIVIRECAKLPFLTACHDQSGYYRQAGSVIWKVDCCTTDGCNTGGPVGGRDVFKPGFNPDPQETITLTSITNQNTEHMIQRSTTPGRTTSVQGNDGGSASSLCGSFFSLSFAILVFLLVAGV